MGKTIVFLFICMFFAQLAYSQTANTSVSEQKTARQLAQEDKELNDRWNNALGSFQFQITNSRLNPQVPISTIELIEKNRLEDKINYIDYRESIKIMILPKSELKKEHQKLELFKYISSN